MAWVFLDWDSTLVSIEGIDELARKAGCYEQVAQLTEQAMRGELSLAACYAQRLQLTCPDAPMLSELAELYKRSVTAGAAGALAQLRAAGHRLRVVSAGLTQAILPAAAQLGFASGQVHAVSVRLDAEGGYLGYDEASLLVHGDGKGRVCSRLCPAGAHGMMVGDGHNDACVTDYGLDFVQYAGKVDRPGLRAKAAGVISEPSLAGLPGLVAGMEKRQDSRA